MIFKILQTELFDMIGKDMLTQDEFCGYLSNFSPLSLCELYGIKAEIFFYVLQEGHS